VGSNPLDLGLLVHGGHVVAAIVEILATLILWAVLRRFATARWSLVLVLLYFLATSVRTVASQALWQHSGVHLAVAVALSLVLREEPVSLGREFFAGLVLGLGAVVRQTTGLVALGIHGMRPVRLIVSLIGAAIGVAPLLAYNYFAFGSPLEQGYGTKPFDTPPTLGLYGLLFSPSRGLLVYTPYVIFAFAALLRAWRWPGEVATRLRWLSLVWLATLVLYATYAEWWGGRVFGSRFLDDLAPVLFAALAWGIGVGLMRTLVERVVFAIMALVVRHLPGRRFPLRQVLGHPAGQCQRRPVEALQLERSAVAGRAPLHTRRGERRAGDRRRDPQHARPHALHSHRATCRAQE